jgi:hypothetical protein
MASTATKRLMMTLKELPLADQSFAQIIDFDYLYADKTKYIYELVRQPKGSFFLSRPRRFGKTMLLHTFSELFSGNRDRFRGLWIDGSDYVFPRHPVIFHSLAYDTEDKKTLRMNIISNLSKIAKKENLVIDEITPDMYLSSLIQALYKKYNSTVVVLIDEYDAPVTRNMDDTEVAKANARILHAYFAALKKPDVSPYLRFTFVTGITRYALTSMDSGGNHLIDISLKPEFVDLCGFTLEEFDHLFADRMESTLAKLKNNDKKESSATPDDLRAKIFHWYDGYNWGGEIRVLNPYSILLFFSNNYFDHYWIQTGRPEHLTPLIKKKPLDFFLPKLESYLSETLRKSELTELQAVPVLFHSGYLTLDKITTSNEDARTYSFRLPNYEVESVYYKDCFKVVFGLESNEALKTKGAELQAAFLAKDAQAVSDIFSGIFSTITYYQRPEGEKAFHSLVQVLLSGMCFKVLSELAGWSGRVDLCLELPDQVYLIIELNYCPIQLKLAEAEKIQALATAAYINFSEEIINQALSKAVQKKLKLKEIVQLLSELPDKNLDKVEKDHFLAQAGREKILTEAEYDLALAALAKQKFTKDEVNEILQEATTELGVKEGKNIDDILFETTQDALKAIAERNYHDTLKLRAKEIIDLGLAISGYGSQVKAAFGPIDIDKYQ